MKSLVSKFFTTLFMGAVALVTACTMDEATPPVDPEPQNNWQQISTFTGQPVYGATSFVIGNKAYVGTGEEGWRNVAGGIESDVLAGFFEYDSETRTWVRRADYGGGAVADAIAFAINGKGYIGLGHDGHFTAQTSLWSYEPNTDRWTKMTDFPGVPRHRPIATVVNNRAYVVGGEAINNGDLTACLDTWEYNPENNSWSRLTDFPGERRWGAVSFVIGNSIYMGFGEGENAVTPSFWAYDTVAGTWTRKADFSGRRRVGLVAASIGGVGYLATGNAVNNNEDLKDLWSYNPTSNRWTQLTSLPAEAPGRFAAVSFVIGSDFYLGLGKSGTSNLNDFWHITLE